MVGNAALSDVRTQTDFWGRSERDQAQVFALNPLKKSTKSSHGAKTLQSLSESGCFCCMKLKSSLLSSCIKLCTDGVHVSAGWSHAGHSVFLSLVFMALSRNLAILSSLKLNMCGESKVKFVIIKILSWILLTPSGPRCGSGWWATARGGCNITPTVSLTFWL